MPRLQSQERFVKSFCVRLAVEYLFQFQTWVPNKNGGPLWTGSVEWNSLNIRNLQTAMPASNGESFARPTLLSFSTGECLLNGDLGSCEGDDRITRMDSPGVGNAISCKRESAQCFAADSRVRQEWKIDFVSKNTKMGENHNFLTGTPENNFLTDHETRDRVLAQERRRRRCLPGGKTGRDRSVLYDPGGEEPELGGAEGVSAVTIF